MEAVVCERYLREVLPKSKRRVAQRWLQAQTSPRPDALARSAWPEVYAVYQTHLRKYPWASVFRAALTGKVKACWCGEAVFVDARTYCSIQCQANAPLVKARRAATLEANPSIKILRQAKLQATNLKRYGCTNAGATPEAQAKIRATNLARRGVPHNMMDPKVQAKKQQTFQQRYGVSNPQQAFEVRSKTARTQLTRKQYRTQDNRVLDLQGFEPHAAAWLESKGFLVASAQENKIRIPYSFEGKQRYYFPDLCCQSPAGKRYLVEVKSVFSIRANETHPKFLAATKACTQRGWAGFKLILWDRKSPRVFSTSASLKRYLNSQELI